MERLRRSFGALVLLLLFCGNALAVVDSGKTGTGGKTGQKTEVGNPVATARDVSSPRQVPLMWLDGEPDARYFDDKQALVEQALSILRSIETSRSRRRKSTGSGIVGKLGQFVRQFVLLKAQSLEEQPLDTASNDANPTVRKLRMAVEGLETAASAGNSDALMLLADMNFYGNYTHPKNYHTAFKRYKELADLSGNTTAQHMVAFMYSTGVGGAVKIDQAKSLLYHTFAALGGDTRSEMTLAFRFRSGITTPRNCEESLFYYKRVADKAMDYWLSGPPGGRFIDTHAYRLADDEGGVYGHGASAASSGNNARRKGLASTDSAADLYDILDYWEMMAAKEDLMSIYGLGKLYYDGSRVLQRNFTKARLYFLNLANMYWNSDGKVKKTNKKGLEKFAARAAGQLGKIYMRGDGVKQNYEIALKWFRRGVAYGDMVSQNGLGFMYLNALGVPKDLKKAAEYFKEASEQGFGPAQCNYGKILSQTGEYRLAADYFETAAKQGVLEAQYLLAEYFNSQAGHYSCPHATSYYKAVVEKVEAVHSPLAWAMQMYERGDMENAIIGFMMGAEQGYESAQANSAYLLDTQRSMISLKQFLLNGKLELPKPVDRIKTSNNTAELALAYWTRSAKQNNIDSFVKMGDYYFSGLGTEPDMDKALGCYQVASSFQQSAQALWNIGYMYENGLGLKQDFHLAKRYYDQALDANSEAYLPVTLSLLKLRLRSIYNTLSGGDITPIGRDDDDDRPSSRTLLEQLFNLRPNIAHPPGRAEDDDQLMAMENDLEDGVPSEQENTDEYNDGYMDMGAAEDDLVESFVILMLVAAAGLLIWYRQQRRLGGERREERQDEGQGGLPNFGWGAPAL